MDYVTFVILVLVVGLLACMTADVILDMETIWNSQFERGSGRVESIEVSQPVVNKVVADLSWVNVVEDSEPLPEVDVIALAKSRQQSKPAIQAGVKVRELLDGLGKQVQALVDYSQLTIRELKAIAKERKLKGYGSLRKAELIAALQSN